MNRRVVDEEEDEEESGARDKERALERVERVCDETKRDITVREPEEKRANSWSYAPPAPFIDLFSHTLT